MNQAFNEPKIQPRWVESKRTEEDYFTSAEKRRGLWFDFFCINPLSANVPKLNARNKHSADIRDADHISAIC